LPSLGSSGTIEVSPLYHAPWLDSIRGTTTGGMVLGDDFVSSDLARHAVGAGLGILIEPPGLPDRPWM
jgi:hypothetical protein